jgi:adenylyltransferase/sulfurtransferase
MEFVARFAEDCKVEVMQTRLEGTNAAQLLGDAHVAVACVDNLQTRLLLSAAALEKDIPLVDGGIDGFYGYVTAVRRGSACLACIGYGDAPESKEFSALGAVAGAIGSLQALETIKILLGLKEVAYNKMIFFDGLRLELETLKTRRNKECPLCGKYESGE